MRRSQPGRVPFAGTARSCALPFTIWRTSRGRSRRPSALPRASTSAATPATCGVAAEVPLQFRGVAASVLAGGNLGWRHHVEVGAVVRVRGAHLEVRPHEGQRAVQRGGVGGIRVEPADGDRLVQRARQVVVEAELVARRCHEHGSAAGGVAGGAVERCGVRVGAQAHAHHGRPAVGRVGDRLGQPARLVEDVVRRANRQDRRAGGHAGDAPSVVGTRPQHAGDLCPMGIAGLRAHVGVTAEEVVAAPIVDVPVAVVVDAVGAPAAAARVGARLTLVREPAVRQVRVIDIHAHVDIGDHDPGTGGQPPCTVRRYAAVEPERGTRKVPLLVGRVGQRTGVEQRVVRRRVGKRGRSGRRRGEHDHGQGPANGAAHQRRPGSTTRALSIVTSAGKLSRRR